MRIHGRKTRCSSHSSSVNYLASVSDLMSGLLFVFIIALTAALIHTQDSLTQADAARKQAEAAKTQANQIRARLITVEDRLKGNNMARAALLAQLKKSLQQQDIHVRVDTSRGQLLIPEEAVTFEVGKSDLDADNLHKVSVLGTALEQVLPCFLSGPSSQSKNCHGLNPNHNLLDAVFIEGHTDNQQYRGDNGDSRNRTLSTARSNQVFHVLVSSSPALSHLTNNRGEALFSISGYGSNRPVAGHEHELPTNDSANRRIEIRFIFAEPQLSPEENLLLEQHLSPAVRKKENTPS